MLRETNENDGKSMNNQVAFFDSFPDAASIIDADYNIIHLNKASCDLHNIAQESAVGKKCFERYGESEPCQNCPLTEVLVRGVSIEKEIFRRKVNAWHLFKAFPIKMDSGEVLIGAISKDITSTKTAEQILVDFNYKIKNFIDRMPIGCILWDQDFRVSMWNPAAEKIFGYCERDVLGKHPYDIIVPADMIPDTDPVKQKLQQGNDSSHRTGENITRDGRRIYCSWLNTPIQDADGKVISVLSMVQDITLERRIQNETIRSAQLASIGQLAASVAHEINNPINGVINYSELLLGNRQKLESKQVNILEQIIKEGERIATIVRSLLNFARAPDESMELHNIEDIVQEALDLLHPEIKKSGINVELKYDGCMPDIQCNPQQIEQVIVNIIKNAIDALGEGDVKEKEISISFRFEEFKNKKEFVLAIENNGPMIPLHLQEKIFEAFMTTKKKGQGTGLGLGISLEIMRRHGGTIRVKSIPDEPVEMALVFPL